MIEQLDELIREARFQEATTGHEWLKDHENQSKYNAHLHAGDMLTYLERARDSYHRVLEWRDADVQSEKDAH